MSPGYYFSEWHHSEITKSVHLCFSLTSGGLKAAVLGPSAISIQRKKRTRGRKTREEQRREERRRADKRKEEMTRSIKL